MINLDDWLLDGGYTLRKGTPEQEACGIDRIVVCDGDGDEDVGVMYTRARNVKTPVRIQGPHFRWRTNAKWVLCVVPPHEVYVFLAVKLRYAMEWRETCNQAAGLPLAQGAEVAEYVADVSRNDSAVLMSRDDPND